jgi:arylsulfatase
MRTAPTRLVNAIPSAAARSLLVSLVLSGGASAQEVLPAPAAPFRGNIGLSAKDSMPDFPEPVRAPGGAPNVVLVLLDDVGFGASSTFGGPIATPTLDRLASSGLRYTQFHTTALCSPTRAALLTGRNHHSTHTGVIMELGTGFPGYDTMMGKDTATVAEILRQHGWNTAWFGKNHNVPDWQTSQAGPFDLWPTGLGFEHFYGFIGGDTSQWRPAAFEGTRPIEPYLDNPNYNFDYDIADQAIRWVRNQQAVAPDKPFFLYYAPGATHAPHHPKQEWIARYRGQFDQGWDRVREETLERQKKLGIVPADTPLTKRHPEIPDWDDLDADHKELAAYMMEVYAAYLTQTDSNVGRVLDAIRQFGQLDNTLVIYIVGDNGASGEGNMQGSANEIASLNGIPEDFRQILERKDELGTWRTNNHYPTGWAHAMCAPFQYLKQYASHYGGTRNGMVISWPTRIADEGGIRPQWHHVIDIVPTILESAGMLQPAVVNGVAQRPIEGASMVYTFDDPTAPSTRRTQYFEMFGMRGIYHDGWVACTTPLAAVGDSTDPTADVIDGYRWELYHVADDFSEAVNLAGQYPDTLRDLQLLFYAEAARYNVLPLDHSRIPRFDVSIRPSQTYGRTEFVYHGTVTRISEGAAPDVKNRSFRISADVILPTGHEEGVIATHGGLPAGYALMLEAGKPVFHYNFANIAHYEIAAEDALTPGRHTVAFAFTYDGGGIGKGGNGTLSVDGKDVARGRIDNTMPARMSLDETFDIGADTGTHVNDAHDVPFRFTGQIERVVISLGAHGLAAVGERALDAAEARRRASE